MGDEAVDECGFTHPTVATKKRHLPFEQGSQLFDTFPLGSGDLFASIADRLVKLHHHLLVAEFVGIETVGLIKDQNHRDAIGFSGCQEAINEGCGGLRVVHCNHQKGLIDVCGKDVTLFGEVLGSTHDIIASIFDF